MQNITFLFELAMMAAVIACLELTFQMFMQPNMILYPYAVLLSRVAKKHEVFRHLMRPLGRCRYCNATWISFYVFVYFHGYQLTVSLLFGLTTLGVYLLSTHVFKEVDPNAKVDAAYGYSYANDTPYIAMLASYVILGAFYTIIYI